MARLAIIWCSRPLPPERRTARADFSREQALGGLVAGVDEVGRGPLAGPVVAAAVIIRDPALLPDGIADSKKLSAARRDALAAAIVASCDTAIGMASVAEIDSINILQATWLAMTRAVAGLASSPGHVLVDGNRLPKWHWPATAIVGGDACSLSIAAASIIAKVHRDGLMCTLDRDCPGYDWARNMGYGTPAHLAALRALGPSLHHRQSFAPVRQMQLGLS